MRAASCSPVLPAEFPVNNCVHAHLRLKIALYPARLINRIDLRLVPCESNLYRTVAHRRILPAEERLQFLRRLKRRICELEVQEFFVRAGVESDQHALVAGYSSEGIRILIPENMPKPAAPQRRVLVTKTQERLHVGENFLLFRSAARLEER